MSRYGRTKRGFRKLLNKYLTSAVREIDIECGIAWRQYSMLVAKFYKLISKPFTLTHSFPISLFGASKINRMAYMLTLLVIALSSVIADAQYPFVLKQEPVFSELTYAKPDSCFFKHISIKGRDIKTYIELVTALEYALREDQVFFSYSPLLLDDRTLNLRKREGTILEILHDALRYTDMQIWMLGPKQIGISRISYKL